MAAAAGWLSQKGDYYPQIEPEAGICRDGDLSAIKNGSKPFNRPAPAIQIPHKR